jgi:small neutral amino acid transporter SnatA (MarC family)
VIFAIWSTTSAGATLIESFDSSMPSAANAAPIDVAMTAMYALDQPKAVPASSSTRMRSRDVKSFESMGLRYQT